MIEAHNPDPFGEAVKDYFANRWKVSKLYVDCNVSGIEKISPAYLFRNYKRMPEIERFALDKCEGSTIDVGACAGSHALYLQEKGINVKAVDISDLCCQTMEKRGVKNVECVDFFEMNPANQKYDTILMLMNGIGIAGDLLGLKRFFAKAKELLAPNGKILFDSSDIDYVFYEKDGSKWINLNSEYYGEVSYTVSYKKTTGQQFKWLFIDTETIERIARENGFKFKILKEGKHYDYLGELRLA
jgi:hypothetical protein